MALERTRAVGEGEAGAGWHACDVGAVVAPVGNEGDTGEAARPAQRAGQGEVGVGDDHPARTSSAEALDACLHSAVETLAGFPDHEGSVVPCPVGDGRVVAYHGDGKGAGDIEDV